mgnify:CR=1 FL=1
MPYIKTPLLPGEAGIQFLINMRAHRAHILALDSRLHGNERDVKEQNGDRLKRSGWLQKRFPNVAKARNICL